MIARIKAALLSRARNVYWKIRGVRIDGYVKLSKIDIPRNFNCILFNAESAVERGCSFIITQPLGETSPEINIGSRCYLNRNVILDASKRLHIGNNVMIGPNTYITDHDHVLTGDRSNLISQETIIEDGVWIGANVTVLKGVHIGSGSVIGAGSVVTKSIPSNSKAFVNPCRVSGPIESKH